MKTSDSFMLAARKMGLQLKVRDVDVDGDDPSQREEIKKSHFSSEVPSHQLFAGLQRLLGSKHGRT